MAILKIDTHKLLDLYQKHSKCLQEEAVTAMDPATLKEIMKAAEMLQTFTHEVLDLIEKENFKDEKP